MYPKRIVNLSSTCLLVLFSIIVITRLVDLSENFNNLTSIDFVLRLLMIAFLCFGLLGTIAIFWKRKWGWIALTANIIHSLVWFALNHSDVDSNWLSILIALIVFIVIITFFFTVKVRDYFEIKVINVLLTFTIPTVLYGILLINPLGNNESVVNSYYLEFKNGKYYLNDSLFTGDSFHNHVNGQLECNGKIKEGLKEGTWKKFNQDEILITNSNFENGILNGKETSYFSWGGVYEEKIYNNGKLDGNYASWFAENELDIKGSYDMGLKEGEWYNYDASSNVVIVDVYNLDTIIRTYYSHTEKSN